MSMDEKVRLQTKIPKKLKDELDSRAAELGVSEMSLVTICLRSGLDVIKVSLNADYSKLMELLSKEYEKQ
jgi:hypothetical protein